MSSWSVYGDEDYSEDDWGEYNVDFVVISNRNRAFPEATQTCATEGRFGARGARCVISAPVLLGVLALVVLVLRAT